MKKGLSALLMLTLVLGATSAMSAEIALPLAEGWATLDATDFEFGDPSYSTLWPDLDQNDIPEVAEFAMLQAILADDSLPNQAAIYGAFMTNRQAAQPLVDALLNYYTQAEIDELLYPMIGLVTMGGQPKWTFIETYLADLNALAAAIWNGNVKPNLVQTAWTYFSATGDYDGDLITNAEEYVAAGGDPAAYAYQVITAGEITLSVTISGGGLLEVGGSKTLTSDVVGGTAPYTYAWTKDGLPLSGQTGATLVLSGTLTDNVDDSGLYGVRVTDDVGAITSADIEITVLPEGSVPVGGVAALGLLVTLCAGLGARKAMK